MTDTHINYAFLRRLSRRRSMVDENTSNYSKMAFHYHKMSETFTEHFPISQTKQPKTKVVATPKKPTANYFTRSFDTNQSKMIKYKQPQLTIDDINENIEIEYKNHPFTFSNENQNTSNHSTKKAMAQNSVEHNESKHKRFVFEDTSQKEKQIVILQNNLSLNGHPEKAQFFQQTRRQQPDRSQYTLNFIEALDKYLDYLNITENNINNTDKSPLLNQDSVLVHKLSMIKQHHQRLIQKYKKTLDQNKQYKQQNETTIKSMMEYKLKYEKEKQKSNILSLTSIKLQKKLEEALTQNQYLQNSFLKEKIENENNRILYKQILMKNIKVMNQDQQTPSPDNTQYIYEENEMMKEKYGLFVFFINKREHISQLVLQQQLRLLRRNNQDISRIMSMRMLDEPKCSSDRISSSTQLEDDSFTQWQN